MQITERELKQIIEDLFGYHWKNTEQKKKDIDNDVFAVYDMAKSIGAVDALGVIYLACWGGEETQELLKHNDENTSG